MKNQKLFILLLETLKQSLMVLLCILAWQVLAFAQTLRADYQFQDNLNSSVSPGQPMSNQTHGGTNSFVTDTVDGYTRRTLRFPLDSGVSVNANVIPNNSYTVVILFRFDEVTGSRRRLFSPKDRFSPNNCGSYIKDSRYEFESTTTTPIIYPNT